MFSLKIDFDVNDFNRTKETYQETRITTLNRIETSSSHSVKKIAKKSPGSPLTLIGKSCKIHSEIFPKVQFSGA